MSLKVQIHSFTLVEGIRTALTNARDLTLAQCVDTVAILRADGLRFWCAWHPGFPRGILRRHNDSYIETQWKTRTWDFFRGETPTLTDVSESVSAFYAEMFAGDFTAEQRRAQWGATRVVFRDGGIHAQRGEPNGIDVTGSVVDDVLPAFRATDTW